MTSEQRDQMPCYFATCPECHGGLMAAVVDIDNSVLMAHALKERRACERAGLLVETIQVHEVRTRFQQQFGHVDGCMRDPKQRRRKKVQR